MLKISDKSAVLISRGETSSDDGAHPGDIGDGYAGVPYEELLVTSSHEELAKLASMGLFKAYHWPTWRWPTFLGNPSRRPL